MGRAARTRRIAKRLGDRDGRRQVARRLVTKLGERLGPELTDVHPRGEDVAEGDPAQLPSGPRLNKAQPIRIGWVMSPGQSKGAETQAASAARMLTPSAFRSQGIEA